MYLAHQIPKDARKDKKNLMRNEKQTLILIGL
jgi:hypothetical protein